MEVPVMSSLFFLVCLCPSVTLSIFSDREGGTTIFKVLFMMINYCLLPKFEADSQCKTSSSVYAGHGINRKI